MLPAGEVIQDRYRIDELIGHGGMGAVYRAHDAQEDRVVAVKVLTLPPGESQLRFRREFRVMSRLQHPNVVRVFESGSHDEVAFLVMEYLRGGTLQETFRGPAETKEELTRRLTVLAAVADALAYVHGEGIVHRDLKPENVLLDEEEPRLMDFGLAKSDGTATVALTQAGEVMGTVAYMSPEQARGREVDARSDLYAFGCLLHWAIVGEPPFTGESFAEILLKQVRDPPQAPSGRMRSCPAKLDALVLDLLQKAPVDRPAQASDVAQRLRAIVAELAGEAPSADADAPRDATRRRDTTPAQLLNPPLLGRDREWDRLQAVLNAGGPRKPVVLEGPAGMGASRLLDDLAAEARARGHGVIRVANPKGVALPYQGWKRALTTLRESHAAVFAQAAEGSEGDLSLLLPDAFPDASPPNLPSDVAQLRMFSAIDALLARCAERLPLLLVVDDLHDADDGTVALTGHVASGTAGTAAAMALALQPEEASSAVKATLRQVDAERIRLEPLGADDTRALVRAMLGGHVDEQLEKHVAERAAGNPFFVSELLSALLKGGQIVRREGAWEWSRDSATLPPSIGALFDQRIEQLGTRAAATAQAASTIGMQFSFEVLESLTDASEDDLLDDLDELLRANLVEEGKQDVYRFAHPLLRESLHDRLPARRRRRYHQKLADLLEEDPTVTPDVMASHLAEAEQPERAARYALIAAREAERVFSNDVAERYYRLALAHLPEGTRDRPEALVSLARVLDRIGLWEEAQRLLDEALVLPASELFALKLLGTHWTKRGELDAADRHLRRAMELAPEDAEVHRNLANVLIARGDMEEAELVLHDAFNIALGNADVDPLSLKYVQMDLGYHAFRTGELDTALDWYATAEADLAEEDDPLFRARLTHMTGLVHYQRGDLRAAREAIQRALEVYQRSGDVQQTGQVLYHLGMVLMDLGESREAVRIYRQVLELGERLDDPKNTAQAHYSMAWIQVTRGAYEEALEHVAKAGESFEQQGFFPFAHQARLLQATILARSRRHGQAEAALAAAQAHGAELDSAYNRALEQMTVGEVKLRAGEPAAGLAELTAARSEFERLNSVQERLECLLLETQAHIAAGNEEEAAAVLNLAEGPAAELVDPAWGRQVRYLRALLAGDASARQEAEDDLAASDLTTFPALVRATLQESTGGGSP